MGLALMFIAIVVLVVVVGFIGFFVSGYNKLVTLRNRYKNAYAQIDVQLQRRYDLIPNLVETAKGYIKHERETLGAVTQARNVAYAAAKAAAANPGDASVMKSLGSAETGLAERARWTKSLIEPAKARSISPPTSRSFVRCSETAAS